MSSSSRVEGRWLDHFCCLGCDKEGPATAVVIGEVAVCSECALDAVVEAVRDGDCEGRDPLPFPEYRR
jgi:hypothetical protein